MRSHTITVISILIMVALIVAIDVLFFRNRFWARLAVNVVIVVLFAVFYRMYR